MPVPPGCAVTTPIWLLALFGSSQSTGTGAVPVLV